MYSRALVLLSWPSLSRKPFSEFSLDGEVIQHLKKLGFATAFEIQDKTLPLTLEGRLVKIFKVARAFVDCPKSVKLAILHYNQIEH